jgi:hypothetical protein
MNFVLNAEGLLGFAVFPVLLRDNTFGLRKTLGGEGM